MKHKYQFHALFNHIEVYMNLGSFPNVWLLQQMVPSPHIHHKSYLMDILACMIGMFYGIRNIAYSEAFIVGSSEKVDSDEKSGVRHIPRYPYSSP